MCNSCEVININGVNCHERGCPDAYKDEKRNCLWCGAELQENQNFCDDSCEANYNHYNY